MAESERAFYDTPNTVDLLEVMPTMGSRDVPASIRRAFDGQVRKIPANPFDIVTIYHEADDLMEVAALIHQRAAWQTAPTPSPLEQANRNRGYALLQSARRQAESATG